jgi:glycosyltransferase involved in cell wall biosynthesis
MQEPSKPKNNRIRVLFVISDLSGGGAERAVSTYLHHLDRSKFEPGLCLWRDVFIYEAPKDVPIWIMEKNRPWHASRTVWRMAALIKRWQPDIVLSFLDYVNLLTGLAIKVRKGHPVWIPTIRNNPSRNNKFILNKLWISMRSTWQIIGVISNGLSESMHLNFQVPQERIVNLYNPVDFDIIDRSTQKAYIEPKQQPTITTMGRLVEQKDHVTLLRAIALVKKSHKINLTIIGDGPLRSKLESLAKKLGLEDIVNFSGFLKAPFPQISTADVFVLSSKWEGFGKALAEAMGCGTAVVSTDCPYGPGEIIEHGKSGLLVPVGRPEPMANAIIQLLDDPEARETMAAEGKIRVRELFNAKKCTQVLEDVFSNVGY